MYNNSLSTPENLQRRGVNIESVCPMFKSVQGDMHTIIFNCPVALQLGALSYCELWKNRNSIIFCGIAKDRLTILTFSRKFLSAYKEANAPQQSQVINNIIPIEPSALLTPPFANFIVNFDGAVDRTNYCFTPLEF
ncbi:hypothetical protein ACH5RR_025584 [Cinchona calisaya]|uniref:Reverse transcriptase zinc-binding domain-containing protein n=1 Tax=Cinchona calisaya TaxID=153742 RepID=A0ABD2Z431_9GENT